MIYRKFDDLPRLSGRRDGPPASAQPETQRVFRRFFHLLERLEKPLSEPAATPARRPAPDAKRR